MTEGVNVSAAGNQRGSLRLSDLQGRDDRGLVCRKCGCRHFYTIYTRAKPGCILRLKECRHCGQRMVTRERAG
ncbi:MAG: hypothetical protein FJ288_18485 [Planctomycetes bacterium]|nr:hypothetical protein [Planctomycetota bacterium]